MIEKEVIPQVPVFSFTIWNFAGCNPDFNYTSIFVDLNFLTGLLLRIVPYLGKTFLIHEQHIFDQLLDGLLFLQLLPTHGYLDV
jgi:hypothetical protein